MPSLKRILWSLGICLVLALLVRLTGVHEMLWQLIGRSSDPLREQLHESFQHEDQQNADGDDEVSRLRIENAELRRRIREYDGINAERGTQINPDQLLRSRIIARSSDAGRHFIHIDAGALEGVHVGDAVLVGWTLIGVVRGEAADHSLVQLITDQDARVAASLYAIELAQGNVAPQYDSPLALGVVEGRGDPWLLGMGHVEARSRLQVTPGMQVVTSGLDAQIPFGLVVGTVESADVSPESDLWEIRLRPHRLWGSYHSVVVLRSQNYRDQ